MAIHLDLDGGAYSWKSRPIDCANSRESKIPTTTHPTLPQPPTAHTLFQSRIGVRLTRLEEKWFSNKAFLDFVARFLPALALQDDPDNQPVSVLREPCLSDISPESNLATDLEPTVSKSICPPKYPFHDSTLGTDAANPNNRSAVTKEFHIGS